MYYGEFRNLEDVCENFRIDSVDGVIVFAAYEYEDYSGQADVLFVKNGKFFHVSGGHCSCYGLESQWSPEEMPIEALRHMILKGSGLLASFAPSLSRVLEIVESMGEDADPIDMQIMLKLAFG